MDADRAGESRSALRRSRTRQAGAVSLWRAPAHESSESSVASSVRGISRGGWQGAAEGQGPPPPRLGLLVREVQADRQRRLERACPRGATEGRAGSSQARDDDYGIL